MWTFEKGDLVRSLSGHTNIINCLTISQDCQLLLSGSRDKTIRTWKIDTDNNECSQVLKGHRSGVSAIAVNYDSKFAASGGDELDH